MLSDATHEKQSKTSGEVASIGPADKMNGPQMAAEQPAGREKP